MLRGAACLLHHTLARDDRSFVLHRRRMLACLVTFAIVLLASIGPDSDIGGDIFWIQMLFALLALSLDAIFSYPQLVAVERGEGFMDLLQLANISPAGVVAGQVTAKFLQNSVLVLLQFPFTLLCVTLGGLDGTQVLAGYTALLAYSWLLSGVGAAITVVCVRSGVAAFWLSVFVFAYSVWPLMRGFPSSWTLSVRAVTVVGRTFNGSVWHESVGIGLAAGAAAHLFAISRMRSHHTRTPATSPSLWMRLAPRRDRAWESPVRWWAFHHVGGGALGLRGRLVVLGIPAGLAAWEWLVQRYDEEWVWQLAAAAFALLALDLTWGAVRMFREEFREHTWETLLLTGLPAKRFYRDKVAGWLRAFWPSVALPLVTLAIAIHLTPPPFRPVWWIVWYVVACYAACVLLAYFNILIRLSLRYGWAVTPFALSGMLAVLVSFPSIALCGGDFSVALILMLLFLSYAATLLSGSWHYLIERLELAAEEEEPSE